MDEYTENQNTLELANNFKISEIFKIDKEKIEEIESKLGEKLELGAFCEFLSVILSKAKSVLSKAYESQSDQQLICQLNSEVSELICVQKEIKTITENTNSLQNQIAAVKANLEEQKSKLFTLRNEERRTRFLLNSDLKHNKSKISKFLNETIPRRFSIPPPPTTVSNTPIRTSLRPISHSLSSENRFIKITNRNLIGPLRKSKITRSHQKKTSYVQHTNSVTNCSNGVTLYLQPINEIEKFDNSDSSPCTPNMSNGNLPMFFNGNSSTSETTTNADSVLSETNSLSIVNSEEIVQDVD